MTFVTLRIYKFYIFDIIPEYHAEISAYGKSFSYSDEGLEISTLMNKHGYDNYELVKRISLGFCGLSENSFMERFFPDLVANYTIDKYNSENSNVHCVVVDLSKAFDCVNKNILFKKLRCASLACLNGPRFHQSRED